jgi:hypothetical protein
MKGAFTLKHLPHSATKLSFLEKVKMSSQANRNRNQSSVFQEVRVQLEALLSKDPGTPKNLHTQEQGGGYPNQLCVASSRFMSPVEPRNLEHSA